MSVYGEGSCQHSFVSMYSLGEKYGDQVCIRDDTLYTLRGNLCDDEYRVYLAPMGQELKTAFRTIRLDAAEYGKKVKFLTLTEGYAEALRDAFPDQFLIQEDRAGGRQTRVVAEVGAYVNPTCSRQDFADSIVCFRYFRYFLS